MLFSARGESFIQGGDMHTTPSSMSTQGHVDKRVATVGVGLFVRLVFAFLGLGGFEGCAHPCACHLPGKVVPQSYADVGRGRSALVIPVTHTI